MKLDRIAVELAALLYAMLGYAVLLYVCSRVFMHLCTRWGLIWDECLNPYAYRAAFLSTVPLLGVALFLLVGLLDPEGKLAQAGLVVGLLSCIGLVVYQAWVFVQTPTNDGDTQTHE